MKITFLSMLYGDQADSLVFGEMAKGRASDQGRVSTHNYVRSATEASEFLADPLLYGKSYPAYLSSDGRRIVTWMGHTLARVTSSKRREIVVFGKTTHTRWSFKAIGVDGRLYYGTHNGPGMYCRMRLVKHQKVSK